MRTALTVLTMIAVLAVPVYGWSETGHRIVASIAFRQLTADERAKVIEILQLHPRFQAEFEEEAPDDLDADEKSEWMFQQADTLTVRLPSIAARSASDRECGRLIIKANYGLNFTVRPGA